MSEDRKLFVEGNDQLSFRVSRLGGGDEKSLGTCLLKHRGERVS